MRRLKTLRHPPIYPKSPDHLPCSSLTHPLPLPSRRPSVSFGGFGFRLILETFEETPAPDIGVEATAGRLVADLLDHGLVAVFTFVSWVRGPVVASVLAQAFDEVERSAAVGRLAKRMNLRINAILGVGG